VSRLWFDFRKKKLLKQTISKYFSFVFALGRRGGEFGDPAGMAIDKSGNLIIADARNHRLQVSL
jgi:hypothetical protein